MATNLKGQGGIKGILLLHGEKIAIGIVGVIALMFVYRALFKIPRLEDKFQADKLQEEIRNTSNEIHSFTWDRAVTDHPDKVKKRQEIAVAGDFTVDSKSYVNRDANGKPVFGIDNSIVAPLILRTDPVMLNAIDVRATGGSGLFALIDEEIRKKQELRLAQEQAEQAKKAADKAKKDALKAKEGGGPGSQRRGPGEIVAEPVDPAHPKRRRIENSARPTGTMLQGGERKERAYWACVVAKVPIREQLKLYQDAFEKARGADATRDFPSYVGFYVERAEVLQGKGLDWKPVPLYDGQRNGQASIAQNKPLTSEPSHVVAKRAFDKLLDVAQKFWAGGVSPDVIDERFAEYPLTLPLPPLVGREWGSEATHPDIPLAINTPPLEDDSQQVAAQAAAQQSAQADANGEFGAANPTQGPAAGGPGSLAPGGQFAGPGAMQRRFAQGPEGGPGMVGPGMMGPGMVGPGMAGAGRRFSGPGGSPEGGSYRSGSGQVAPQHSTLPSKGVDFYLLRFFDFSVEPGKKYRYRVKLVLADPNYNLPQGVLSPAVLDRQVKEAAAAKLKKSDIFYRVIKDFSDPSPIVGIPMAGNVRLAETKVPPADKFNDEPSVKMLIEAFDVDETGNPIQTATEKDFHRGYVANTVQDAEYIVDGGEYIDTQPSFKFLTGMTLLDVDGGTKISKESRDLTVPARSW